MFTSKEKLISTILLVLFLSISSFFIKLNDENYSNKHHHILLNTYNPIPFSKAKDILHKKIFNEENIKYTFYCNCKYDQHKNINHNSCQFAPRANANRAKRLEWEHVVPTSLFGQTLPCWKNGGRKNCTKTSQIFQLFEGDMHNLKPAIGEINGDRSNLPFSIVDHKKFLYGKCNFFIGKSQHLNYQNVAEPNDNIKGNIARIYLYMNQKYNLNISQNQLNIFKEWNEFDPPDQKEIYINQKIKNIQGDDNIFISNYKKNIK